MWQGGTSAAENVQPGPCPLWNILYVGGGGGREGEGGGKGRSDGMEKWREVRWDESPVEREMNALSRFFFLFFEKWLVFTHVNFWTFGIFITLRRVQGGALKGSQLQVQSNGESKFSVSKPFRRSTSLFIFRYILRIVSFLWGGTYYKAIIYIVWPLCFVCVVFFSQIPRIRLSSKRKRAKIIGIKTSFQSTKKMLPSLFL